MTTGGSTCRSCGAPLIWGRTAAGKAMPLDAAPTAAGIVALDGDRVLPGSLAPAGLPRYTSHFATCPQAGEHRRRR